MISSLCPPFVLGKDLHKRIAGDWLKATDDFSTPKFGERLACLLFNLLAKMGADKGGWL